MWAPLLDSITSLILPMPTMLPFSAQAASTLQSFNTIAASLGLRLSWAKTKLQNVGAGNPPTTLSLDGAPVEGVHLSRQQTELKWLLPTRYASQRRACQFSDEFSTTDMEMQLSQHEYQSTSVSSTSDVCPALRN